MWNYSQVMCFSPALLALLVVCMHDVCMGVWWFGDSGFFLFFLVLLHIFFSCVEECMCVCVGVWVWVGVGVQPLIDSYEYIFESESRVV